MPRKKKEKPKNDIANQEVIVKTFEIRKFVKAPNIVEAFNMDVQTPPTYIVETKDEEIKEVAPRSIGFKNEG